MQFEYGSTYVPAGATLREVYGLLGDAGYRIGRLHPDHVDFQAYALELEHYRMGNYIAVRDPDLVAVLGPRH